MKTEDIENIELRYLKISDYQELKAAMISAYTNMPDAYWKEHHIESLIEQFPEGQVVIRFKLILGLRNEDILSF